MNNIFEKGYLEFMIIGGLIFIVIVAILVGIGVIK